MGEAAVRFGVAVDVRKTFQTIDGWGVNINSKDWRGGALAPVMELLVDELGATLFRQDVYGNSNWTDLKGPEFDAGAGMGKWLNGRGIQPYLTLSGIVPRRLCAADGKTLMDTAGFARMAASFAEWARRKAGIRYTLFGPMNETDIGPVEGPAAGPATYVKACEALVGELDRRGLKDLRLVVAEQAHWNLDFVKAFLAKPKLMARVGAFGMHTYGDVSMAPLLKLVRASGFPKTKVWMTEYGDLEQTGDTEFLTAWLIYRRLMQAVEDGFQAALNWDAFDNYHDHDESWSIYGLIRRGIRTNTPKKRFWAVKQMYRFVRPGWTRVAVATRGPDLPVQAFVSPDRRQVTVTGMNATGRDARVNVMLEGVEWKTLPSRAAVWRTSHEENCARVGAVPLKTSTWPHWGIEIPAPADSIFTATTLPI